MARSEHNMSHRGIGTAGLGNHRERVQPAAGEPQGHERGERRRQRPLARALHQQERRFSSPRQPQHLSDSVVPTGHYQIRRAHFLHKDPSSMQPLLSSCC